MHKYQWKSLVFALVTVIIGSIISAMIAAFSLIGANVFVSSFGFDQAAILTIIAVLAFIASLLAIISIRINVSKHGELGQRFASLMTTKLVEIVNQSNFREIHIRPALTHKLGDEEIRAHVGTLKDPLYRDRALKIYCVFDVSEFKDPAKADYRQENIENIVSYIKEFYEKELRASGGDSPGLSLFFPVLNKGEYIGLMDQWDFYLLDRWAKDPKELRSWIDYLPTAQGDQAASSILMPSATGVVDISPAVPILNRKRQFLHVLTRAELLAEFGTAYSKWLNPSAPKNESRKTKSTERTSDGKKSMVTDVRYHLANSKRESATYFPKVEVVNEANK